MINKFSILEKPPEELYWFIDEIGEKRYRIKQILDWIYKKQIFTFDEMVNIPKKIREIFKNQFLLNLPEIEKIQISDDNTKKYLLNLCDNSKIEMVIIPTEKKNTLCISSQVGCSRRCEFCATAKLGLKRNLSVSEIISQILIANKEVTNGRITNLVFMGMGEPLDNFDNIIKSLKILQHDETFKFSPRRTTISTCGVVPKINSLAETKIKTKLAVSLNSAIEEKRTKLMPINNQYSLKLLKESLINFRKKTNYRITIEYIMISNYNMGKEDVIALKAFTGDLSCKINLIPWNPVKNLKYKTPSELEIYTFKKELEKLSAAITIRKSRGENISAACGQLAATKGVQHA